MIIQPKIRGYICTTAHPQGCAKHVENQINYVKKQSPFKNGPKNILVVGSSTGYGLSSRIVSSFGGTKGKTIGVFFEKPSDGKRTATAGWYNMAAFEKFAQKEGIYAKSFNGDAFSDSIKQQVVDLIKKDLGKVDLVIYSLASPRRQHPKTGELAKSVLKPIGSTYKNKSLDLTNKVLETVELMEANDEEIQQTISVMGGEDWQLWIDLLRNNDLLDTGVKTIAYSYMGPELTYPVYRQGTIGKAKEHLEATAKKLSQGLKDLNGQAVVSVNKALVTQSSAAIPFIPLYFILLKKVMIEQKVEEDCIAQIYRLFASRLYHDGDIKVDHNGLVRMDDFELADSVQKIVDQRWKNLDDNNLKEFADLDGFDKDFLKLFGFGFEGVDYNADVDPQVNIPSIDE
ncbi:MAG: trans-2-enoyl-CoA reductase family protein [Candidatus Omnitrophica bacterium]|nr:trans-2-enoyl-CoA reductase family protein [Candidatus Omnitrophota bacterium]